MEQIQDVESHNIYRLAKKLRIPAPLRWRMIKKTSRDNARTPMQWDGSEHAGFTSGTPWLKINSNYTKINMAAQTDDPDSVRCFYKKMIALRAGSDVLKYGAFRLVSASGHLFLYERILDGKTCRVLLNFGRRPEKAPCSGHVLISSYGRTQYDGKLLPWEAVVIEKGTEK